MSRREKQIDELLAFAHHTNSMVLAMNEHRILERILHVEESNHCLLREILHALRPKTLTHSVINSFTGDSPMPNNALTFNVGDVYTDTITPLLADGVTPSGGVLSNVVITFSDPSATFVLNSDNTVTFTGVADSAGVAVAGSTAVTVTDTDGVVSTWNIPFTVTTVGVTPPPPSQLTQSVANVFTQNTAARRR